MATISYCRLNEVNKDEIISLMNCPQVGRLLPLLTEPFNDEICEGFVKTKEQLWAEHGYGPKAVLIDGQFAGWGGLQAEEGEVDFALILHPSYWGYGRQIYADFLHDAFHRMEVPSITILFPPTRTNQRAISRLGFISDGMMEVDGHQFHRYRLMNPNLNAH
jgi:hypothetical protein